ICDGFKVCIEISLMAADAGLIPVDKDVIAIGGTGRGADTAVVLKPAESSHFLDLRVHAILCKPI
ncbi:MAG: pyruvate kinase alpha/beta domain-containing protein, partial [Candidatus Freyarchaeota archaeon]